MSLVRKQYFSFSDVGDSGESTSLSPDDTKEEEDSAMITFDLALMP